MRGGGREGTVVGGLVASSGLGRSLELGDARLEALLLLGLGQRQQLPVGVEAVEVHELHIGGVRDLASPEGPPQGVRVFLGRHERHKVPTLLEVEIAVLGELQDELEPDHTHVPLEVRDLANDLAPVPPTRKPQAPVTGELLLALLVAGEGGGRPFDLGRLRSLESLAEDQVVVGQAMAGISQGHHLQTPLRLRRCIVRQTSLLRVVVADGNQKRRNRSEGDAEATLRLGDGCRRPLEERQLVQHRCAHRNTSFPSIAQVHPARLSMLKNLSPKSQKVGLCILLHSIIFVKT